uniref:DUF834 domain-containing protein n=1 Tax=Oryza glumipatula TaxID=40148 RepID=A0A0E0B0U1_9ORYZ
MTKAATGRGRKEVAAEAVVVTELVDAADVGRGCGVLTERRRHGLTGGEDPDNGNGAVEDGLGRRWRHFR